MDLPASWTGRQGPGWALDAISRRRERILGRRSGVAGDAEVVPPAIHEHLGNAQKRTLREELIDQGRLRAVSELRETLHSYDPPLLTDYLDGLTPEDCDRLVCGFQRAEEGGMVITAFDDTADLVAGVLYDLMRKPPHRFTWTRFLAFIESALRITYPPDSYDWSDDVEFAKEVAWPLS